MKKSNPRQKRPVVKRNPIYAWVLSLQEMAYRDICAMESRLKTHCVQRNNFKDFVNVHLTFIPIMLELEGYQTHFLPLVSDITYK